MPWLGYRRESQLLLLEVIENSLLHFKKFKGGGCKLGHGSAFSAFFPLIFRRFFLAVSSPVLFSEIKDRVGCEPFVIAATTRNCTTRVGIGVMGDDNNWVYHSVRYRVGHYTHKARLMPRAFEDDAPASIGATAPLAATPEQSC